MIAGTLRPPPAARVWATERREPEPGGGAVWAASRPPARPSQPVRHHQRRNVTEPPDLRSPAVPLRRRRPNRRGHVAQNRRPTQPAPSPSSVGSPAFETWCPHAASGVDRRAWKKNPSPVWSRKRGSSGQCVGGGGSTGARSHRQTVVFRASNWPMTSPARSRTEVDEVSGARIDSRPGTRLAGPRWRNRQPSPMPLCAPNSP